MLNHEQSNKVIDQLLSSGAPGMPPGYDIEPMYGGGLGVYHDDEHTITLHVSYGEAVRTCWGNWLQDIGDDWSIFLYDLSGGRRE